MASWREEVMLEGEFFLLPKKKGLYKVILTRRGLFFHLISNSSTTYEEKSVQVSDIVGCHCLETNGNSYVPAASVSQPSSKTSPLSESEEPESEYLDFQATPVNRTVPRLLDPFSCGFVIFAYPFKKKIFSSKKVRQRIVLAFEVHLSSDDYEEKRKEADKWKNLINCLCRDLPVDMKDVSSCVPPPRGRLLLLINPHSGPGKAHTIYKNEVAPVLWEADIPHKVIITKYAGHASELLRRIKLSEWYGVVIISGDGLIFESINGIMQRDDWASSINLPVGCIPGGSGNALCCSINYAAGEPIDSAIVLHSTFILVKHRVVPMDLVLVHIPDRTVFSFLSITWGMMADIDFESEKYRNLGEARFTVGAITRIINLRTYKARISFLPVAEYLPKGASGSDQKVLSKIRRFSLKSRSNSRSTISSGGSDSPRLLAHRSYSMDNSGYSEHQLRMMEGKGGMSKSPVVADVSGIGEPSSLDSLSEHIVGRNNVEVGNASSPDSGKHILEVVGENINGETIAEDMLEIELAQTKGTQGNQSKMNGVNNGGIVGHQDMSMEDVSGAGVAPVDCALEDDSHTGDKQDAPPNSSVPDSNVPESNVSDSSSHSSTTENNIGSASKQSHRSYTYTIPSCKIEHKNNMTVLGEVEEIGVEEETYHGKKADFTPVPSPLLPPLSQDVPDNWVILNGEFVLTCLVYQTHLGSDMLAAPDAHLHDGHMQLIFVREGISRNALLNLFLSFGQGGHVHSPHVEIVKVLAFRLEPSSTSGNIMIDGERFPPSPIQAQILPGLARVMAIK